MPTRLQLARKDIISFFDSGPSYIFGRRDIEQVLARNRGAWRLAQTTTFAEFLEYLLGSRKLRRIELPFPHRKETRYVWGNAPIEEVLLTIKKNCHFSHLTAAQLLELSEQDPKTIYVNHEQPPKPVSELGLSQQRIDAAFKRRPRRTRNTATVKWSNRSQRTVCLLNGKHTGYLGVETRTITLPDQERAVELRLTSVERTLIDIAVRPFYSGGIGEVLNVYRRSRNRASINRIAGLLRKLSYVYPYHQAIGFYLESAGYESNALDTFHKGFDFEFDFYLDYGMAETALDRKWRVHAPKGIIP